MTELVNKTLDMEEDTQKGRYLMFIIDKESYGIEIKYVKEIIGIQPITEVPEFPEYIKGIINLRGKIIPVMDIRLRFKKESKQYNERTCIVIIDTEKVSIGLIVDRVEEVLTIPDQDIIDPPQIEMGTRRNNYIRKIGKVGNDVKLLIDCDKMVNGDEIDKLSRII